MLEKEYPREFAQVGWISWERTVGNTVLVADCRRMRLQPVLFATRVQTALQQNPQGVPIM